MPKYTYICWIHTDALINDAMINDAKISDAGRPLYNNIFISHFIARVRKRCVWFYCERELETEHNWNILTPNLWPSRCVFPVLFGCSTGGLGPTLLDAVFLYCILSASSLDPKLHRGSRGPPRSGVAFPTTACLQLSWTLLANPLAPWASNSTGTRTQFNWLVEPNSII